MSTHLVDEADRHDRVVLLHRGVIVADGTPVELRAQAGRQVITVLEPGWDPPAGAPGWRRERGLLRLHVPESDARGAARVAGDLATQGVAFTLAPPTLADVFGQLTGSALERDLAEAQA
jgi:ABC-2 type transport system ATP-binding protein